MVNKVSNDILSTSIYAFFYTYSGYPFDLIKSRIQSNPNFYKSEFDCAKKIYNNGNRSLFSFYKGSSVALSYYMLSMPIQYTTAEVLKKYYIDNNKNLIGNKSQNYSQNYIIGGLSGIVGPIIANPLQVLKVSNQTLSTNLQMTFRQLFMYNYTNYGIYGFYRGLLPSIIKESMYSTLFIGTYFNMRDHFGNDTIYKNTLNSVVSYWTTWLVIMPVDYIKTNLQKHISDGKKLSIIKIIKNDINGENIFNLWRGYRLICIRTVFISCVAVNIYESFRNLIN